MMFTCLPQTHVSHLSDEILLLFDILSSLIVEGSFDIEVSYQDHFDPDKFPKRELKRHYSYTPYRYTYRRY